MANPRITLRPHFTLYAVGGLFVLMVAIPVFTELPFLNRRSWPVYLGVTTTLSAVFAAYLLSMSYQWVEMDGDKLRGRKLLSRRLEVWNVADIAEVQVPLKDVKSNPPSRGYVIRFSDDTTLRFVEGEMEGLDKFLVALADAIKRVRVGAA